MNTEFQKLDFYRFVLDRARSKAPLFMKGLLDATKMSLSSNQLATVAGCEINVLRTAIDSLNESEEQLCFHFSSLISHFFKNPRLIKFYPECGASDLDLAFDSSTFNAKLDIAKRETLMRLDADVAATTRQSFQTLNQEMCSILNVPVLLPNPINPEFFLVALKEVIGSAKAEPAIRYLWLYFMSRHVGPRISHFHHELLSELRREHLKNSLSLEDVDFNNRQISTKRSPAITWH
jgi:hypothetical protein